MDADLRSIQAAREAADKAFTAWQTFKNTDPAQIDEIVQAMARAIEPEALRLAELAVEETGYGNVPDKRIKNLFNSLSVAEWLRDIKTLGLLWQDERTKIAAIGEPMGLVAALIPVTNPTSTIIYKVLSAVKAGNAIVCAPHPRGVKSGVATVEIMARVAEQMGAPKGLIQCLDQVTNQGTAELMKHRRTSVVMATGGPAMVQAAYSSGKPTLAVGAGNVPCYVHASKKSELAEVAEQILTSKSFDYGTACVSEQAIVVDREIAGQLRHEMRMRGGYFCTASEAERLAKVIFTPNNSMNPNNVGQSPESLASQADIQIPPNCRALIADQSEIGWHAPLSAEKLNPVLAWYESKDSDEGIDISERIAKFGGWGHSAVVHSNDPGIVSQYSRLPVGRVLANTPGILGGMGFSTDLEPSFMLGTGTSSGSIVSDNVTALHLINIKRVAWQNRPWRDIYDIYGE